MKPKIFIGSSSEGLRIAWAIENNLKNDYDVTVWKKGVFKLTKTFFDSLLGALDNHDYGIFVFSPDDIVNKRGEELRTPRDNVVFELGLYVGRLGSERCFFVVPTGQDDFHLPSDLSGVASAGYDPEQAEQDSRVALEDACHAIKASIASTPEPKLRSSIQARHVRDRLYTLRVAKTEHEVLDDVRIFIEHGIYPGREIRIGFAKKVTQNGRPILSLDEGLVPPGVDHREFSYPQTIAAWALIEGTICSYPQDKERKCEFKKLRTVGKFERAREALLATGVNNIKQKIDEGTLTLGDVYQDWIGVQPDPYYKQFVSVPVPVLDKLGILGRTMAHGGPSEYGVLNIDAPEDAPLVTDVTMPLLMLASDIIALGFEAVDRRKTLEKAG